MGSRHTVGGKRQNSLGVARESLMSHGGGERLNLPGLLGASLVFHGEHGH